MKLDAKKSKAAVKDSTVKQKKAKAKVPKPAKAPKVKKNVKAKKLKRLITNQRSRERKS